MSVRDASGAPLVGFPLRFELDQGLRQTNMLAPAKFVDPSSSVSMGAQLVEVDDHTFETRTDADGEASISYHFEDRQPPSWKVRFFNAERLPDQSVVVVPLRDLPSGARLSVATPNP